MINDSPRDNSKNLLRIRAKHICSFPGLLCHICRVWSIQVSAFALLSGKRIYALTAMLLAEDFFACLWDRRRGRFRTDEVYNVLEFFLHYYGILPLVTTTLNYLGITPIEKVHA